VLSLQEVHGGRVTAETAVPPTTASHGARPLRGGTRWA
jgi:hypothetical protein